MTQPPKSDYDSPWKQAIGESFESFLQFFFPPIWADIDWSQGYLMLNKELRKVHRGSALGQRQVDALVRVHRLAGDEQWVLIHIEVQSQVDPHFAQRMAVYHGRIRDLHNRDVCSLALLGDENPRWRPRSFVSELWGCRQTLRFPVKKLLDFPRTPRRPHNPFSWLVAAHLQAQSTRNDPLARKLMKLRLVRGLFTAAGLKREEVERFFHLVDWVLALPQQIEYSFQEELASFAEERNMVYINSIERMGIAKGKAEGLAEGKAEGLRESILQVLKTRWGGIDPKWSRQLEGIGAADRLSHLLQVALTAESPQQWQQEFDPR